MRKSGHFVPLIGVIPVLLLVLAILPSALNLPSHNPSTTLEYAPIPPSGEEAPPAAGDISSLSLASSSSLTDGAVVAGQPTAPARGSNPATKRCVGHPPRQTEDKLSPPCVAFFEGDNFGATQRGVTKDEVRVVVYFEGGPGLPNAGVSDPRPWPSNTWFDLGQPDAQDEASYAQYIRLYQRYFNNRFQTYNRFVHFWVHYGRENPDDAGLRADAAEAISKVKPFAVIDEGGGDTYVNAIASYGVPVFIGTAYNPGQPKSFYTKDPGFVWSYIPTTEQRADLLTSYACKKLLPYRVSFGGSFELGKPRRLGLLHSDDPAHVRYANLIERGITGCGGRIAAKTSYRLDLDPSIAAANIAKLRAAEVTTIIRAGGEEYGMHTQAAQKVGYYPEWVVAGDRGAEGNLSGRLQDQSEWRNARTVTTYTAVPDVTRQSCYQAARESDENADFLGVRNYGCDFYPDVRQLFTGIQVAGPRLTSRAMDQGFHAIPHLASTDPTVPACFYEPGDYACMKDAQAQWWDPSGTPPGTAASGCWRMMERGKRYLAGAWPKGDVEAQRGPNDPCNAQAREPV